ncbi:aldehyde dehydrogenase family protein [Catellatospora sp. KI3]|uniref:aldehyde dehydrogenase family protein n=1 Tax=Catellatospora sp. KI3 TaxID=3041620 RepID=UPI0024826107|nr:aldehyde dehydrogenase family protein [Catellatospora sp. KI3]MDI1459652.1 aldehyde dehydrogenase family protein [Catellatospora sp. KI3]
MTTTSQPQPGASVVSAGELISTNPATGEEVARLPVSSAADVKAAVARARAASDWWAQLSWRERRRRLLRWRSLLVQRMQSLAELMHREGGKPVDEALLEIVSAVDHAAWAAKQARKVLGRRRVPGSLMQLEYAGYLEYQPYGVIGVIGPWNFPIFTPFGSIAYALAAGNAVVFKPSEYTPAIGQFYVDAFNEVVPEHPVLQIVHGGGEVGAALCRSGVDKLAFTGSGPTGAKVMAACAESLTPVLIECGGKDAMIVADDADVAKAAETAAWGANFNAGQACVGIERAYVHAKVYDDFVAKLVAETERIDTDTQVGPITMPGQRDIIARHIDSALADGGRALLGGPDSVRGAYVRPTILVDVPHDSAAVREETFGPTIVVTKVASNDEAVTLANDSAYGLGSSVFSKGQGMAIAARLRTGMTAVNSAFAFAVLPELPFGGVGQSGFGRIHGHDGLKEFARAKSIAKRRMPSTPALLTFRRTPAGMKLAMAAVKFLHGRSR